MCLVYVITFSSHPSLLYHYETDTFYFPQSKRDIAIAVSRDGYIENQLNLLIKVSEILKEVQLVFLSLQCVNEMVEPQRSVSLDTLVNLGVEH